ncbi:MAG TPA: primosomal protein N', partial [Actinomycetota bacterium]|nr:primosomal protein N' [Actinomycetota bacterium]
AVPEVALGSRVVEGLAERWPDVARVDVTRPEPERARSWLRLARGHGLGAGGRSVVLAPAPSLSLLVLDDEHHPSYKEDRSPRYDARVLAERRAAIQGAACVFVSTTPSVELAGRAKRGDLGWVGPSRAVERDRRPPVELVETDPDRQLGGVLHGRIRDTLRAGGRVGLLVPRSGFARAVWCAECRRSLRCPVCEAGLVYAREDGVVRCPRCSFRAAPPDVCPTCGGVDFRFLGAGSERLAEQIGAAFPRARVVRMDPAVLETHGSAGVADAQIYVTTWIGVKETLRPEVELVGVLAVDHLVRRPEWRAGERAYQALAEMAEWAGPTGRLLVQTDEPRHHAIQAVVRGSYRFFAERELEQRRELGYPPFSELVKVRASGDRAQEGIAAAAEACRAAGARVLGPIAVTASDGGRALEILAKASSGQEVARSLRSLAADPPDGARMQFDVDPR